MKIYHLVFVLLFGCSTSFIQKTGDCYPLREDLKYIYNSLKNNYSGYSYDKKIKLKVDKLYLEMSKNVSSCTSQDQYLLSLSRFFSSFKDPHVKMIPHPKKYMSLIKMTTGKASRDFSKIRYFATGLSLKKINERYFVNGIDSNLSSKLFNLKNTELLSCNGITPNILMEKKVLPYQPVSVDESGAYVHASKIFFTWKRENESINCTFLNLENHKKRQVDLIWYQVSSNYLKETFKDSKESFDLYDLSLTDYGAYIRLSSFAGYTKKANKQLSEFANDAKKLRDKKIILLDIRGNTGGALNYGLKWIKNLFGEYREVNAPASLTLSSRGNINHFESLYRNMEETNGFGSDANKDSWHALIKKLKANIGNLVSHQEEKEERKLKESEYHFKGKIYLLTDYKVFSSGENFAHFLKLMPNVKQVGLKTNASTYYSDVRFDIAPSGLAFMLPTRVFLENFHKRESGDPLVPDIEFKYNIDKELIGKDSLLEQAESLIRKR